MTNVAADNSPPPGQINRAKTRQLLAGLLRSNGHLARSADDTQIELTRYDWHQPRYFSSSQLAKLNSFANKVAVAIAEKFTQLYHSDFNIAVTSIHQHFASGLFDQIVSSGQDDYYLSFGSDQQQHLCGFLSIPAQTALSWTKQLLGDAESEKDISGELHPPEVDKQSLVLSQLEESLLYDVACSIVESLSVSLRSCLPEYNFRPRSAAALQPACELVKGSALSLLAGQGTTEFCKITFSVQKADSESSITAPLGESQTHLLILANILAPIVGKTTETDTTVAERGPNESQGQDFSKVILEHLQRMPVSITARLAATVLTFEQLMSLRPSDVLLLNKAIDEPIELIVEGRTLFRGWPAKSAGQHAVVITELSGNAECELR